MESVASKKSSSKRNHSIPFIIVLETGGRSHVQGFEVLDLRVLRLGNKERDLCERACYLIKLPARLVNL
jgi:hypothetical protein